jgi:hypothetical protein
VALIQMLSVSSKATMRFSRRTSLDEISFFKESKQGLGRGTNPVHVEPRRLNRQCSSENENRMCIRKSVRCI